MPDLILFKRNSVPGRWEDLNPVLDNGEPGWDKETKVLKVGDGVTPWNTLPPIGRHTEEDIEQIVADYLAENPYPKAGLNVVGAGQFVILEHDADSSSVPDGTFIARLPE